METVKRSVVARDWGTAQRIFRAGKLLSMIP